MRLCCNEGLPGADAEGIGSQRKQSESHSKLHQFLPQVLDKKWASHYEHWITGLKFLGGCPGVKPAVGVTVLLPVVNNVGLGEDLSASSHLITICSI